MDTMKNSGVYKTIKINTLWNLFGAASPMAIGLITLPYILQHIGVERLGILTLLWSLIGYFSVFDFGLGRALTYKISSLRAENKHEESIVAARSGLKIVFITGLVGALLIIIENTLIGVHWLGISDQYSKEVKISIFIAALAIPITTMTTGLKGILEGWELFKQVNIYKLILGLTNFVAPVLSIKYFGPDLNPIVLLMVIFRLSILLLHARSVTKRMNVFKRIRTIESKTGKELLIFGSWMTLSNLLSPLMVMSDRFIISSLLGAGVVAYYTIPSEFLVRLLIIPAAITTAIFPVFSRVIKADQVQAVVLYRKTLMTIVAIVLPLMGVIMMVAHIGLEIWIGNEFADHAYIVAIILSVGIVFNSAAQTPHSLLQSNGDAKTTSIIHLVEFVVYAPMIFIAIYVYGIIGAAVAWSVRTAIDFIMLHYFSNKLLSAEYVSR